ncbi:MAG: ribose-phosphate pyrophosphokinase, partial [Pseudomonadota bacterium]
MLIIAGKQSEILGGKIADELQLKLTETHVQRFRDSEIYIEIKENVRGANVYVVQSTNAPVNDSLMELLITVDALRRASATRITAVIPYYGYARQDRKTGPRTPISAKLVARLLETAGANRVVMLDLHAGQIQGFFEIPSDNLYAERYLVEAMRQRLSHGCTPLVVSPDIGGVQRARGTAKRLECDLAIIDKRRPRAGEAEVMNIIGDANEKYCILVDDIVDSAGTLCKASQALLDAGAIGVSAYVTHGVFSPPAIDNIMASPLERVVVTDTIHPTKEVQACPKIEHISISAL